MITLDKFRKFEIMIFIAVLADMALFLYIG